MTQEIPKTQDAVELLKRNYQACGRYTESLMKVAPIVIGSVLDRIAELERELAEARRDGERLDHLESVGLCSQHSCTNHSDCECKGVVRVKKNDGSIYWHTWRQRTEFPDLRTAIDAAKGSERG